MRLIDASGIAGGGDAAPARRHRGPAAVIVGQDRAVEQFASAWASRKLHHAWLLAGPKGVGKASFAHAAARRVLADAAGPPFDLPGLETPRRSSDRQAGRGRQPSRHALARAAAEREDRQSRPQHQRRPGPRARRVLRPDARRCRRGGSRSSTRVDELEPSGANALAQDARGAAAEHACSSSSAMRRAGCCRRSARAAGGSISRRSTMTP